MQNYVENMVLTFSILDQKNLFRSNLVKKNKSCQSILNFGTKTKLNMQNSMVIFLFLTINIFLGQIWSKNSELFVQS